MKVDGRNQFGGARFIAVLLLAGVFLTGAIAGVAANEVITARDTVVETEPRGRFDRFDRRDSGRIGARGEPRRSMAVMLQRQIGLTDEQREQVEEIFEARRLRTETVLRELEPRLQAQRDSTDLEIREILTEAQAAEFDRMISQRREVVRIRYRPPGP